MAHTSPANVWNVDLPAQLANLGDVQIGFRMADHRVIGATFIRANDISLEDQCRLAGEAIAAIEAKLLRSM